MVVRQRSHLAEILAVVRGVGVGLKMYSFAFEAKFGGARLYALWKFEKHGGFPAFIFDGKLEGIFIFFVRKGIWIGGFGNGRNFWSRRNFISRDCENCDVAVKATVCGRGRERYGRGLLAAYAFLRMHYEFHRILRLNPRPARARPAGAVVHAYGKPKPLGFGPGMPHEFAPQGGHYLGVGHVGDFPVAVRYEYVRAGIAYVFYGFEVAGNAFFCYVVCRKVPPSFGARVGRGIFEVLLKIVRADGDG